MIRRAESTARFDVVQAVSDLLKARFPAVALRWWLNRAEIEGRKDGKFLRNCATEWERKGCQPEWETLRPTPSFSAGARSVVAPVEPPVLATLRARRLAQEGGQ